MDLNKEKAIDMILKTDSYERFSCSINVSEYESEDDLIRELDSLRDDYEDFCDEVTDKFKDLQIERKKLKSMMSHEIYEIGEEKGLWKLNERQKRLI
jgi:hypothetical protein